MQRTPGFRDIGRGLLVCECGVPVSQRHVDTHLNGPVHAYATRIGQEAPTGLGRLKCGELASQLGISWGYVRSIAQRIGIATYKTGANDLSRQFHCECGSVLTTRKGLQVHKRRFLHNRALRIRRLLERDCVTFSQVAKRLGVSRERVRQLAQRLGIKPGRQRQRACAMAKQQTPASRRRHNGGGIH